MAKFIQTNQKVNNQVNAETIGVVNFDSVQDKAGLASELRKLLSELSILAQISKVDTNLSIDVEAYIKKSIAEMEKPEPKKDAVLENIEKAKSLLDGITSAASLVAALMQATQVARTFFL